jgi:hypothetical protein
VTIFHHWPIFRSPNEQTAVSRIGTYFQHLPFTGGIFQ